MITKKEQELLDPIVSEMVNSEEITRFPIRRESNGVINIGIKSIWENDLKTMDKFFLEGKVLQVWQVALFTMQNMKQRGIETDWTKIEKLAGGIATSYYPDGKLHVKVTYRNGKVNGLREVYDKDGKLQEQQLWVDDVLQED